MSLTIPKAMIGKLEASKRNMRGLSTPSGRRPMTRSRRSRTSLAAASRSVPQAKARRTLLWPSEEVELISSIPGTAAMASSIGLVMSCSTTLGSALV